LKERDVARHALFPIFISIWRLPTCDRLAADSPTPFPVDEDEQDPFNRPHSRAVVEIASNTLLREVFSAKFHFAKALLYGVASPGKLPLHRYIRFLATIPVSGRHRPFERSFAQNYGSRLLTLRQNLRFFRCRPPATP
jgi:hypothetical protein